MVPEYMTGGGRNDRVVDFDSKDVDEIQIDDWFLLEQFESGYWFLRIGNNNYTILPNKTLRLENDE